MMRHVAVGRRVPPEFSYFRAGALLVVRVCFHLTPVANEAMRVRWALAVELTAPISSHSRHGQPCTGTTQWHRRWYGDHHKPQESHEAVHHRLWWCHGPVRAVHGSQQHVVVHHIGRLDAAKLGVPGVGHGGRRLLGLRHRHSERNWERASIQRVPRSVLLQLSHGIMCNGSLTSQMQEPRWHLLSSRPSLAVACLLQLCLSLQLRLHLLQLSRQHRIRLRRLLQLPSALGIKLITELLQRDPHGVGFEGAQSTGAQHNTCDSRRCRQLCALQREFWHVSRPLRTSSGLLFVPPL